ncbi:unnamed protein product [Rhodiola kirilowii]
MAGFKGIESGLIVVVLVGILCGGVMAQSSCTSVLLKLSPCLNFITGNSSIPSSSCCTQLVGVVQSQPLCLCTVLGGGSILGITINQTRALELPGTCNVKTPPVSQCNSAADEPATSPVGSPIGSPSASPPDSTGDDMPADHNPVIPSDPSSGSGSALSPSANGSNNDNSLNLSIYTLIFVLSVATFTCRSPLV